MIEREIIAREASIPASPRPRRLIFERAEGTRWFYEIRLEQGLANGWLLMRRWGRCGTRGCCLIHQHLSEAKALEEIERVIKIQRRRGYRRTVNRPVRFSGGGQLSLSFGGLDAAA